MPDFPHVFPAADADIRDTDLSSKWRNIRGDTGSVLLICLALFLLIFGHHPISGGSMYPTYHDGQQAYTLRPFIWPISQGDVVIAYSPSKHLVIKRVAACPGDTLVVANDGSVTVNGEPYTYGAGNCIDEYMNGMTVNEDGSYSITLGKGQYYLLGDNHENSADSRTYGPFSRTTIWEKVVLVV